MNFPTGTVTFLFTDIEGSTKLAQEFADTLPVALEKHNLILSEAVESNNGLVFEIVGDAFFCAFENAEDAVNAALDAQINLAKEKWDDAVVKVRIGIHSGNAEWNGKRYMGCITLARSARVMSAAYGEQILISSNTYELCKENFNVAHQPVPSQAEEIHNESDKEKTPNEISFRNLGERRLKDLIHPMKLYQVISPYLPVDFPPLKTLDARPNNLPIQLTSFIGREKEMVEIKVILGNSKLLTLLGSGGAGKTRLAIQVGADMIDDFSNGVFIAELAPVTDPSLIVQTLLNSIEVKEEPGKSLDETLTTYLRDKEMLIILDNCEHVISECANLTETILSNCAKLKIITTSRESLNCSGEVIFRVPSLTLPDTSVNNTPENLTQFESVRLFIERALSVNTNFRVNNNNVSALAEICSRLDGIPLAIELAAARVKVLPLEKINERLKDRFKLLTGGKRTALPRQQTLKAMIDWSYDLLSEEEKILWRRLSVFVGGFTFEAAEKVCGDQMLNEEEIFDLLNNLVEKSIIIHDENQERFRILESPRQYGLEKLEEEGKYSEMLTKHLVYYLELCESAESKLTGPEQKEWLDILESENTNLYVSLDWSIKGKYLEEGLRLAGALGRFWLVRGHFSEGSCWYNDLLEAGKNVSKPVQAKAYLNAARMARMVRDSKKLDSMNEKCLALYREIGDKRGIAYGLNSIGVTEFSNRNLEKARSLFQESLDLAREINDKYSIAFFLGNLAEAVLSLNDFKYASELFNESMAIYREQGNKRGIAYTLMGLGSFAFKKQEYESASSLYEESILLNREIKDKQRVTEVLTFLIETEIKKGQNLRARLLCEECLLLMKELKNYSSISAIILRLAEIDYSERLYERSAKLVGAIEDSFRSLRSEQFILEPNKYERILNELKEKLGEGCFTSAFSEGRAMTLEEAVEMALNNEY